MNRVPAIAGVAIALLVTPAWAVDGEPVPPRPLNVTCPDGQHWNPETRRCEDRALLPERDDDTLYEIARSAAHAGQTELALDALRAMRAQDSGRVLTYFGFVHRNRGDWALARRYYTRALALDPDNHLARSYLGMGLVEGGDLTAAQRELAEIRARGGAGTEAEAALAKALATGTPRY